jgi:hypothetical protein
MAQGKIASKLVKVMDACHYVQKLGKNTFHNYKYAMAADVLEKVNKALVENGLAAIVVPELIEFKDVTTKKGDVERLATVKTTITLLDSESGETLTLIGLGSGQDNGDKAIMKAQTASIKYAWMLSLQISTGDDPEADEGVDERSFENKQPNGNVQNSGSTNSNRTYQSSTQPAKATQNKDQDYKTLTEAQIKRFYGIANRAGATANVIKIIVDNKVIGTHHIDPSTGKKDFRRLTRAEYDDICNLFQSGEWKTYYHDLMRNENRNMNEAS